MDLFRHVRSVRVIDQLRQMFPGKWRYCAARNVWQHEDGWHVYPCAMLAPRYDGDDDSFITVYYRSDTHTQLVLTGRGRYRK
jgi:hypothetical protein